MIIHRAWRVCLVATTLAACASTPATGSAFNGSNLDGWKPTPPWFVRSGAIVCPISSQLEPPLVSTREIKSPCEVVVELQLLGRSNEDGRGFWLKRNPNNEAAGELHVRIDNSPNEFQLKVLPDGPIQTAPHPLAEGPWYRLTCRIDTNGKATATLDGTTVLTAPWPYGFPLTLGLECQRSGAAVRKVDVRALP